MLAIELTEVEADIRCRGYGMTQLDWECAEETSISITCSEACLMEASKKNMTGRIYL
jgi:hypothetical protein